jgi:hypothetical protein
MIIPSLGTPGGKAPYQAIQGTIFRGAPTFALQGGRIISGTNSRDWGNTGALSVLRPGLLMGKITSSGKYAPTILGVTLGTTSANSTAYTSGGTSICVAPAAAVEIVRRVGASGNLTWVGPPTAAGTNAVLSSIAYSAVNTSTGVITTSTLGANLILGGFCVSTDGSGTPITLISDGLDGYGLPVTDMFSNSDLDVPFSQFPIGGTLISANIINWPSDTTLRSWIFSSLNGTGLGNFSGDNYY